MSAAVVDSELVTLRPYGAASDMEGSMATDTPELEVDDAIVLLLAAPSRLSTLKGQRKGITRLEKLIFLLERETPVKEWMIEGADFRPHNFGPFSAKVYQAVDLLSAAASSLIQTARQPVTRTRGRSAI